MRATLCAAAAVLLWFLAWPAAAIDTTPELQDPVLQARYEQLIRELRCMQCQNNSIADSPVGLAADLRREVRELLQEGKTDAEIHQFMTDRYGDFILYRPPFVPRTWLLWLAPALLLAGGGYVAYRIVARRARLLENDTASVDDDLDDNEAQIR